MLASGAIGVANAMPLIDTSTTAEVPPISTLSGDGVGDDGTDELTFPIPASSTAPSSTPTPSIDQAPTLAPQPVAPRPAATAYDSVDSPDTPASVDD